MSQAYGTGACVYSYFGILEEGLENPIETFTRIEHAARECVLACGGSLSHHHGVGKARKRWYAETMTPLALEALRAVKRTLDPDNVFGADNLFDASQASKL